MPLRYDTVKIRDFITNCFSLSQLDQFCYDHLRDYGVSGIDSLGGESSTSSKAHALVREAERKGWLNNLVGALREARPRRFPELEAVLHSKTELSSEFAQELTPVEQAILTRVDRYLESSLGDLITALQSAIEELVESPSGGLDPEVRQAILDLSADPQSEAGFEHKLKVGVPLFPFLAYEGEVKISSRADLVALWQRFLKWVKKEIPPAEAKRIPVARTAPVTFNHGYVLLVGVGSSRVAGWSLPVTVKDAQALHKTLVDPLRCGYSEEHIHLLHDGKATRGNILKELTWLAEQVHADPEATVIVYFSGHGWLDEDTGRYYLIPHDVEADDIPTSALVEEDFSDALRGVQPQKLLVILDCCHAGGMADAKEPEATPPAGFVKSAPPPDVYTRLREGQGRVVMSSSRGSEKSWVRKDGTLSIFTDHLLEALSGKAFTSRPGEIRVLDVFAYLDRVVPISAKQHSDPDTGKPAEQHPLLDAADADNFPIALLQELEPSQGYPLKTSLRAPTGAVPLDSPFYVERNADAQLMQQLEMPRSITTIRGARQTGKSSLLVRGVEFAKKQGALVVHLNCQGLFDRYGLSDMDQCFKHWSYEVARQIGLNPSNVDSIWKEPSAPKPKMSKFVEDWILKRTQDPVVLAMDEMDVLLRAPFYEEFFSLLRSWYNEGAAGDPWKKLSVVMAISTYPSLFISNIHESPFNVGVTIELRDFSEAQVRDLNKRHGEPLKPTQIPEIMELLGGHPYLIRQALYTLAQESMSWRKLTTVADKRNGPFGTHLYAHLDRLYGDQELVEAMRRVVADGTCPEGKVFMRLESAGLVKRQGRKCVCYYGLYELFFGSQLL